MKVHVWTLAAALLFTACGGGSASPTAPITPLTPTPSPSGAKSEWAVTQRFVSVDGPDNCWVRSQRAKLTSAVFPNLPMTVTRSGDSITLEGSFFQVNYAGTLSGREFSTTGSKPLEGGGATCDGITYLQRPGVSKLSGSFSESDQLLTAREVNSYLLTSGEAVTYTWDWQATRK